jgi:hypothetical protein
MATSKMTVPYTALTDPMQRVLPDADAQRLAGLTALQAIQVVKAAGRTRELERLKAKLGDSDPRVVALAATIEMRQARLRRLSAEVERASTPVVTADAETWVLHGRVRDETLAGVPGRKVALFDAKGATQFASAQTDDSGYFHIELASAAWQKLSTSARGAAGDGAAPALYARVLPLGKGAAYVDGRALVPSVGVVNYMEIEIVASAKAAAATGRGRKRGSA